MATINDVAGECGLDIDLVRRILREDPTVQASKETLDLVFGSARKLGYDLKKLKLGKRMDLRRETVDEILQRIQSKEDWSRADIIDYLEGLMGMVERVHNRAFPDEFGKEK